MPGEDRTVADAEEADLLRRTAAGDRSAFAALVKRHQAAVLRLARALTAQAASAEDVLQETFLAVYRHAGTWSGEASVRAWVLAIARHAAARHGRRHAGEPDRLVPLEVLGENAGWGAEGPRLDTPEDAALAAERRRTLEAALGRLSPEDREVLVVRDLEGLPGPEAAALLDLPLATLKTRLHRARLRLMGELRRAGVTGAEEDDHGA